MPTVKEKNFLLAYLTAQFPATAKTKLKQFLKYGSVAVNGAVTTAFDHALRPGDRVELLGRREAEALALKARLPAPIVYEDGSILVANKPPGLLTMGTEHDKVNTLYYALTAYAGRIFIVHRLDRDASGLVVFAKEAEAKRTLQDHWGEVTKKYYAVLEGTPAEHEGLLESHLVEDNFRRVYSAGRDTPGAKLASTRYRVVRSSEGRSLVDVTLITGRKNQIRVHFAELGCPIVGDSKYGDPDASGRLLLHAYFLSFKHPHTGKVLTFKTPLPKPFLKF